MFTLTVSFRPNGSNIVVISQVAQLLAQLETQALTVVDMDPVVEPVAQPVIKAEPVKAARAKRAYTDAETRPAGNA